MSPRRSGIQWRDADEEALTKAVKDYNRKLDRLIKKDPALADALPDRLSKRALKSKIETRQDFNKFVRSAERFLVEGSEKVIRNEVGLAITKYERKEIAIKMRIVNRRRADMLEKYGNMDVYNQGVPTGMKRKEMGSARLVSLKPKKFNFDKMTKQHYDQFIYGLNKQAMTNYITKKDAQYKANYIRAMRESLPPKYKYLITIVKNKSTKEFMETIMRDQNANIEFLYDPIAMALKAEVLREVWIDS